MMGSMMGSMTTASHAHAAAQNEAERNERNYSPDNRDSSASFRFSLEESSATRASNTTPAAQLSLVNESRGFPDVFDIILCV